MAVVSATASAVVLLAGIDHFEINLRLQCTGDEVEETGLSAAAVVFRGGYKQGQVTASAVVSSFAFLGVQRAGVGAFCTLLAQHLVLRRRQTFLPFGIKQLERNNAARGASALRGYMLPKAKQG